MKLTGKALELFNAYLFEYFQKELAKGKIVPNTITADHLPEEMLWGIVQKWAESVGVMLNVGYVHYANSYWIQVILTTGEMYGVNNHTTREDAWNDAIERLDEAINKNNEQ
jgi:hypothetical protein